MSLERFIKFIKEGEPVAPGTPNRPLRQLDQNIQYLKDIIDAAHLGSTVYAREQAVESTLEIGMPVYWNTNNGRFEGAIAKTETDPNTGYVRSSPAAEVWGIIAAKHAANNADILLFGYANIDIKAATDSSGIVPAGTYYLSGVNAGKLILQKPSITAPVLRADGSGNVFVNPSFVDFLDNHQHFKFDLLMEPAGNTSPPYVGVGTGGSMPPQTGGGANASVWNPVIHRITNADSNLRGWLPADDAIFDGNAPLGAKFGYNLSAEPQLDNLFPPIPLESVDVELQRPSIYEPLSSVQIDISDAFKAEGGTDIAVAAGATTTSVFNVTALNSTGGITTSSPELGDTFVITSMAVGALGPQDIGISYRAFMQSAGNTGDIPSITVSAANVTGSTITFPSVGVHLRVTVIKDKTNWKPLTLSKQVLDDFVKIDRNGIWWMSNCYDQVPWPTDFDSFDSISESDSETCPRSSGPAMRLYFTKVNFATDHAVVSSLTSVDSRIKVYCAGSTTVQAVGDLDIDLDFSFVTHENQTGSHVLKSLDADTTEITRGPVTEGLYATTPSTVTLIGDEASFTKPLSSGVEQTVYQGVVGIGLTTTPSQILASQLVRLDGVTEEHTPLLYLGMNNEYATSYVVKFEVPEDAPDHSFFSYRLRIIGRIVGTLPKLTIKYEIADVPAVADSTQTGWKKTAGAEPSTLSGIIDTTTNYASPYVPPNTNFSSLTQYGTMAVSAIIDTSNQCVEMSDLSYGAQIVAESTGDVTYNGVGFYAAAGSIIYLTVTRNPTSSDDAYAGELGIVAQTGVLNRDVNESPWKA